MTYLPSFDDNTHSRTEKNHPTRVCVVVDEVQENHGLDKHVGYDLKMYPMCGISVSPSIASDERTVLRGRRHNQKSEGNRMSRLT